MILARILALAAAAACVFVAAASGGQALRETIHIEDSFVDDDFCGAGLAVDIAAVMDIRVHVVPHGPESLEYFLQHGKRTETLTNLANGKSLTSATVVNEKDKVVTDHGDGTLTVIVLATGTAVLYGEDGKAIARNPGQLRFELFIDDNGTPEDPSDDVVERGAVVKGSTGRSDDFCEAAVPALS